MSTPSGFKQNATKFILDLTMFIGFLVAFDPRSTGIVIHEWLAVAGMTTIVVHLLLNWNWIAEITSRIFRKIPRRTRINYILNWFLFIDGVLIMLTGFMISQAMLPSLGIHLPQSAFWTRLHSLTANLSIFLLGLHVALHWDWIVGTVKRYILRPVSSLHLRKGARLEPGNEVQK